MINSIKDFGKSVPRNIRKKLRYFDIWGVLNLFESVQEEYAVYFYS